MDKIQINYNSQKNSFYEYQLRIPEDFNWFIISRCNKENGKSEIDNLVYNGSKILLYGYYYKNQEKIEKYYNESQNEEVQKEFISDLLNSIGINWFTLKILDKLNFDTNYLKRKYWKYYYFNKSKYILQELEANDEDIKKYDIYCNFNQKKLGQICTSNGNLKISILPNNKIEYSSLSKSKIYSVNNDKVHKLIKNRIR